MDRRTKHAAPGRAAATSSASELVPGRVALTDRLGPQPAPPGGVVEPGFTWTAPTVPVAPATAEAHGLVQFDATRPDLDLDGARAIAVAADGFAGGGAPLPHLAEIQRAFGRHDVTGVRAHVGGAAADSAATLGARAYASGDQVAFARPPDLFLAAHEAAHVVQQRGGVQLAGGVGRSGDRYEQHANEVAAAVVAGRSAEALLDPFAGAGGGGAAIQRDDEEDEAMLRHEGRRAHRQARHQAGREEQQEVYLGTDVGVVDDEGAPVRRHVGGGDAASRTDLGRGESVRGGTTRRREDRDGRTVDVDTIDEERRTRTGTTTRRGTQEHGHDAAAMAADLRAQLEELRRAEEADPPRVEDPADPEQRRRVAAHQSRLAALQRDIERLREVRPEDDPAVVQEIAARRRVLVQPRYRTTAQDLTTRERGVDPEALREGRVRHADRTTTERTTEEASSRTVRETSREVDAAEGRVTFGRREEDETTRGDRTERVVDDRSTSVAVGGGVRGTHSRDHRHTETGPDGVERERASRTEARGGIVADGDGWGVTSGGTQRVSQRQGQDREDSAEVRRDVTVRENAIGASQGADLEARRGARRYGARTSADGSFTIDIEAMNDETPPRYRLVFTIHAGVSGQVSASHGSSSRRGVRAGVRVGGDASADLVLRRTITAEQAEQYWTEADRAERGEATRSDLPEFGRLARIRAGLDNAGQIANATAIAGDAGAARAMAEGEETELTLRGGVTAGGNLGHRGEGHDVGVSAERGDEWTRRVRVERIRVGDADRVRVTVTFEHTGRWHVEGQGGIEGTPTIGVRRGGSSGDGDSVRFTLDPGAPTYDEQYARIVRTTSRDELRALAQDPAYQRSLDYTEHSEQDSTEGHEEVQQGAGVRIRRTGRYAERVRRGQDGSLSGTVDGSQDTSMEIRAGDTILAQGGNEGSSHAVVERDGQMDVTLQHREHGSDPLRSYEAGRRAQQEASGEEAVRNAVSRTPRERLRQLLETEYSTLRGFHLDAGDIETVVARAGDRARWDQCASSPRMLEAWHALRAQLRGPRVDRDEAATDPEVARRLAIARHLARFYQQHGEYAQTAMHNVLRNWGAAGTAGVARDSAEEQVGSEFEWPHALRSRQQTYEQIRAEVRDLERAAAGEATQGDLGERSAEQRYARALDLHERLTAIYTAVAGSGGFQSEAARASLLRHIDGYRMRLRRLRVSHREQGRVAADAARADRAPDQLDRSMQEARTDLEVARAQVQSILRRLQGFKTREQAQLHRANDLSYSYRGREEAVRICGQLHAMAQTWYREVQDLRRAYETLGTPRAEWQVSERGGTRSRTHEPEIGWLVEIYLRCHEGNPVDDGRRRAAQWREEFRTY